MRSDMARVITERPRSGGGVRRPKGERKELARQINDFDDTPARRKQPLRSRWREQSCEKEFTDVLGPLRGYAQSVVGRPWAEVHSEICAVLSPRSAMAKHAADHLWDFLIPPEHVLIAAGGTARRVRHERRHYGNDTEGSPIYVDQAYADPRDGIIKRGTVRYSRYSPKPRRETVVRKGRHFRRWAGVWYEVFLEDLPDDARAWRPSHSETLSRGLTMFRPGGWLLTGRDIILGDLSALGFAPKARDRLKEAYGVGGKYAVGRRQIDSRTIRRMGLRAQ